MRVIVAGFDGTDTAENAVAEAVVLSRATGADLHVVRVVDDAALRDGMIGADLHHKGLDDAADSLRNLAERLGEGSDSQTMITQVLAGSVEREMLDYAGRVNADLIVVGNRRVQGLDRLLGSVAVHVLRRAECSVYVAHTA
jgi:nucleotide-binding universal stress UspA family protein